MPKELLNIEEAVDSLWQLDNEMESLIKGLKDLREEGYANIRIAKTKGLGTDWILGEMMGIDKAIAFLERDPT
jgi:hypothetical protein